MLRITIPLNPRTKKNGQRILKNFKTGRRFIAPSEAFETYQKDCGYYLGSARNRLIAEPVNVMAVYYMGSRHEVDIINLHSALHDVLVHYGVLADDNSKIVMGTDGSRVKYDKENPRTEVLIEREAETWMFKMFAQSAKSD